MIYFHKKKLKKNQLFFGQLFEFSKTLEIAIIYQNLLFGDFKNRWVSEYIYIYTQDDYRQASIRRLDVFLWMMINHFFYIFLLMMIINLATFKNLLN
jgi:hypothetical protein